MGEMFVGLLLTVMGGCLDRAVSVMLRLG